GAIGDYTSGALDGYEAADVAGLLSDRLTKARERLEEAREKVKALCEPVMRPRDTQDYLHYFCTEDTSDKEALAKNEPKRLALYKEVAALMRAYGNIANEMAEAKYGVQEIKLVRDEVVHYDKMCEEVKIASGDYLDMKRYEPAMRRLLDSYIRATESEVVSQFKELGLVELIVNRGEEGLVQLPAGIKKNKQAMSETIENNIRKVIIEEQATNPKYYEEMSELLDALIRQRREQAIEYKKYLEEVKELARMVTQGGGSERGYPSSLTTGAQRALYDNLGEDEPLALRVDTAVRYIKKDDWVGNPMKEREVAYAIRRETDGHDVNVDEVLEVVKNQRDYR
ncbi:MAG: restriction endonuclease subunit R, partial [Desulfobulbaceae bacterium]|nr:restriction endonuclease subunit R [Desulfobulbaceae bacterium]